MPLATPFPGLVVEGAFFPPDAIEALGPRVALAPGKRKAHAAAFLPGFLDPASYALPPGIDIDGKAQHEFAVLKKAWREFDRHRENSTGNWTRHLIASLGYGMPNPVAGLDAAGRTFPIHFIAPPVPLHMVPHGRDLDARAGSEPSPHALLQEYLNRSSGSLYGIVTNGLRLRLLRDNVRLVRQAYMEFDIEAVFQEDQYATFAILYRLVHASRFAPRAGSDDPASCLFEQAAAHASSTAIRALETLRGNIEQALRELGTGFLRHGPLRQKLREGTLGRRDYHQQLVRVLYRLLFLFIAEDRGLLHPDDADPEARDHYSRGYSMRRVRALAMAIKGSDRHHDIFESTRVVLSVLGASSVKSPERSEGRIEETQFKSPERSEGRIEQSDGRTEELPLTSFRALNDAGSGALNNANHPLGLVPLGSLFRPELTPDLNDAPLPNSDYLAAIRALVTTTDATGQRRVIDLSQLGAEEIGSVYERLLEIEPVISWDPPRFDTPSTAGNERKTTGSYYTPDSLVQAVLDSALDPVIDAALKAAGEHPVARENALLALRICDPACGSGHFLVAAARRLGLRLARARALDHEPSPPEVREALREVISRCVYGVDLNPMAVELCQFALWLEALSPGRPLGFLRHHIRCGNSLMGATAALLQGGIPDEAFAPIEGDDRKAASALKKQNKEERNAQGDLFVGMPDADAAADYLGRVRALERDPEETVADILAKDREFEEMQREATYRQVRLKYDLWCAAFAQRKVASEAGGITTGVLRRVERSPHDISPERFAEVRRLAEVYRFFHFEVEFPTVFASGGFDCVLGNPPWERIKLQEQEYFAAAGFAEIAEARNAAVRKKLIEALEGSDSKAHSAFLEARRAAESESQFARGSGLFPLCGRGDVNTYALFAELNRQLTGPTGRAGFIVPTGIATDDTTKKYFATLVNDKSLESFIGFKNERFLFAKPVEHTVTFGILNLVGIGQKSKLMKFVWNAWTVAESQEEGRHIYLDADDFALLNPNTGTCPVFKTQKDAEITKAIYRRMPVLWREEPEQNPWGVSFMSMLHMANDSGLFRTEPGEGLVRLYQANMLHQFDHRWATFETVKGKVDSRQMTLEEKQNPQALAQPQYWVPKAEVDNRLSGKWDKGWLMGWRDICRNTDVRTTIAGIMPREGVGHTFPLVFSSNSSGLFACFYANWCSFVFDYVARQKVGGTHLTYTILYQLPVLPPEAYGRWEGWIRERVLELVYTATDLEPFARDLGYDGPPFAWDPDRRFRLRCELDALFFRLYGVSRDDAAYIMGTFNIIREKERKEFRTFRTCDEILRVYDGLGGDW
jgi:hypothetical protein